MYALRHVKIVKEHEVVDDGYIVVSRGRVRDIGKEPLQNFSGECEDLSGFIVLPGFIDTHIHGVEGIDITWSHEPEAILEVSRRLVKYGVTSFVPTTVSAPHNIILAVCRAVRNARAMWGPDYGARVLGLHLEGPYISREMAGAHDLEYIREPSVQEFREAVEVSGYSIVQVTVAPEVKGCHDLIRYARQVGVVVSAGHTCASYEEGIRAIEVGVTKATHLFNAMKRFHHRDPGIALALIEDPSIYLEVIADYIHLHPAVVKNVVRYAGADRVVLVTDAIAATGLSNGDYVFGSMKVQVRQGVAKLYGRDVLAGSVLTMDRAFRNLLEVGFGIVDVARMSSTTPARSLNLDSRLGIGKVEKGCPADIVVVDESYRVRRVYIEGEKVYEG